MDQLAHVVGLTRSRAIVITAKALVIQSTCFIYLFNALQMHIITRYKTDWIEI